MSNQRGKMILKIPSRSKEDSIRRVPFLDIKSEYLNYNSENDYDGSIRDKLLDSIIAQAGSIENIPNWMRDGLEGAVKILDTPFSDNEIGGEGVRADAYKKRIGRMSEAGLPINTMYRLWKKPKLESYYNNLKKKFGFNGSS